jgi:hypothetical protein
MHMGTLSEGLYWATCVDTSSGFVELSNFSWAASVRAGSGVRCEDAPVETPHERGNSYSGADRAIVKFWLEDERIDLIARHGPMEFGTTRGPCPVQPSEAAFEATARTIEEVATSYFSASQRAALRARGAEVRTIEPTRLEESGSRGTHEDTEYYCTDFGPDRPPGVN